MPDSRAARDTDAWGFRSLPASARILCVGVYAAGVSALVASQLVPLEARAGGRWERLIFIALAALASAVRIPVTRPASPDEESGTLSLSFAVTFAAIIRLGPAAGTLVGGFGALTACIFPRIQRIHQLFFNVCTAWIAAFGGGAVYVLANSGTLSIADLQSFFAVVFGALTYWILGTGLVAGIIALQGGLHPVRVWRRHFAWTGIGYVAAACSAVLALLIFGEHVIPAILCVAPVVALVWRQRALVAARDRARGMHRSVMRERREQMEELYYSTIESLALAIDAKDQYTHQHILRVQQYAVAIGRHLRISDSEMAGLRTGALLHDIGKLGVPEYVLLKPGRLTDQEFEKIRLHTEIGAAILAPVHFPWPVLPLVKYHHERWDGTGYPEGLKGKDIPQTARILAVADVYDALTSSRSYRAAWSHGRAVRHIVEGSGRQFDPEVVDAFVAVVDDARTELKERGMLPGTEEVRPDSDAGQSADPAGAARQIHQTSTELFALHEVAQALSASIGLTETLDILAKKMEAIFPGTACAFLLKDDDGLAVRAAAGINKSFLEGARTVSQLSRTARVADGRSSWIGAYDRDDLLLTGGPLTRWEELRAALIVPIVYRDSSLGTINLYHPMRNAFAQQDRELAETIAGWSAHAIMTGRRTEVVAAEGLMDPVTGAYNAAYLEEYVAARTGEQSARGAKSNRDRRTHRLRAGDRFSLVFIAIENLEEIREQWGREYVDATVREIANRLRESLRFGDTITRPAWNEFAVLLPGVEAADADRMAERLQRVVRRREPGEDDTGALFVEVRAAAAAAAYPGAGHDATTLLEAARAKLTPTERGA